MENVKVHLKEIIKYVLLLGLGIQIVLGTVSGILWIYHSDSFGDGVKALLSLGACCVLSYVFLRWWCKNGAVWMYGLGTLGIVTTPVVLQTSLEAGKEMLLFGLLCVVFISFLILKERVLNKRVHALVTAVALVAISVLCNIGCGAPSLAARLASRCCYPQLYSSVFNTPQELEDKTGYLELRESLRSADGIYTVLYPSLLQRHGGSAGADATCYELAIYGLGNNTKDVVMNALWDIAGYHFPMPVAELQLQGKGYDSVTGHNYGTLTEKNGTFTQVYWKYSVVWSVLSVLLTIGISVWNKALPKNGKLWILLLFEVAVLCFVMHGAGVFDYKNLPVAELIKVGLLLDGFYITINNKDE